MLLLGAQLFLTGIATSLRPIGGPLTLGWCQLGRMQHANKFYRRSAMLLADGTLSYNAPVGCSASIMEISRIKTNVLREGLAPFIKEYLAASLSTNHKDGRFNNVSL